MSYDFKTIEEKWRMYWRKNPYFKTRNNHSDKKFYCLDMFPYPSGAGLHVGHWKGYVFSDVYARMKWLMGYNVLHPMGWDAFGLPAENYAIKQGIHPAICTKQNIESFKKQLEKIGAMYDWDREVNTTDPDYYRWTQWIFLQMFKMGLAYEQNMPINWCPKCLTGLANEEVVGGACDRCGTQTFQKPIRQWVLRITKYAEKLISGLEKLDWPEKVKLMQTNWIGKSVGAKVTFKTDNGIDLVVFTTRPDTLFGASFLVMAPDHDLVDKITTKEQLAQVKSYQTEVAKLSDLDRTSDTKDKTGVFTGHYAINPVNNEKLPIYLSSYVLKHYGTGIIMAVPAHDQRDFEFAKKFDLPIKEVIKSSNASSEARDINGKLTQAFEADGIMINSGQFDGLDAKTEGAKNIIDFLSKQGNAEQHVTYKLRDWTFSRQRYWGEPIPLVHCKKCGIVAVPEDQLPILLPDVEKYEPTGTGESPLAGIEDWVNTSCPECSGPAKRETNTMPQWAGSCWYFLRYTSPHDDKHAFNPKDVKYWMPVDLYVGGIEHAVLHLLYSRFYIKVLHDAEYLDFDEPFAKLFNQGMVCMKSSITGRVEKMSKSKGNVVTPDEIIDNMGADTLRMYELFMGPPELDCEWQSDSIKGVRSFLNRLWAYLTNSENILAAGKEADEKSKRAFHRFLKKYQERIDDFKVNTAVSAIMEYLNELTENKYKLDHKILEQLLVSISIITPHFSSELIEQLLGKQLENCKWQAFDASLAAENDVEFAIQVNGKLRGTVVLPKGSTQMTVEPQAKIIIANWLQDKQIVKVVFVSDRLISFVVK
ncbi:MAG: leucine--tRNA ligase [Candidatus Babeliales bacterium]|jgi:leucyl-tRNA synthetase|nr:MAG: Leucine-tRNA ligase [candidate division TM6 bacterium GW2011_GWF2_36_6]